MTALNRTKKSSRSSRQKPQAGYWDCEHAAHFEDPRTQRPSLSRPLPGPRSFVLPFSTCKLQEHLNLLKIHRSAATYKCSLKTTFFDRVTPPWLQLRVQCFWLNCFWFNLVNSKPNLNNTHLYIYPASMTWKFVFKQLYPHHFLLQAYFQVLFGFSVITYSIRHCSACRGSFPD